MKYLNPEHDTPPFEQWIFLDMGSYFTFGRILKISPNDEDAKSEYLSFDNDGDEYIEYQFYIQPMTSKDDYQLNYFYNDYHFESDLLSHFSDSINTWALLPYQTKYA